MELKAVCNVKAIRQNLKSLSVKGKKLLFMVKANAYGHGAVNVALGTQDLVDFFGVATVEEGIELRKADINTPILVSAFLCNEAYDVVKFGLTPAVFSFEQILSLEKACENICKDVDVFIKFDTGMNRLGIKSNNKLSEFLEYIKSCKCVEPVGAFSHFRKPNKAQLLDFYAKKNIYNEYFSNGIFHIQATSTAKLPIDGDMIRIGIGGYGYCADRVTPAMKVYSKVIAVKRVEKGEYVSYGDFKIRRSQNIAVIFGGYADGIRRKGWKVFCRGKRYEVLSVACMDMIIIGTGSDELKIGEEVCILGEGNDAECQADFQNTICYEILTGLDKKRVNKVYLY